MDKILSYLPDNVHVRFGFEHEPQYYGINPEIEYKIIIIPKSWLKHGERGSYSEWTIKETYKKKFIKEFGEEFIHTTERIEVLEWNQLESVCYILKQADKIGFDLINKISQVNDIDIKYLNTYDAI